MKSAQADALAGLTGLHRIGIADLDTYKQALGTTQRNGWQQYFPFLYFYYAIGGNQEFLLGEEEGALCTYILRMREGVPYLRLAFLPMPLGRKALTGALARVRDFNRSKKAEIYWVDEENIGLLSGLGVSVNALPMPFRQYLYDPKIYRDLSGGKMRELRHNQRKIKALGDLEVRKFQLSDAAACIGLLDDWAKWQENKYETIAYRRYTVNCIEHGLEFDDRDLLGRVVVLDGRIRAFGFAGEIRSGLANLFIVYADHAINGLNKFLTHQMMLQLSEHDLVNSAIADTPGLMYAKESLFPVYRHGVFRVHTHAVA